MKYLLDTNVLLFLLCSPDELSNRAEELIRFENALCLSIASLWEIAIKQSISKLKIRHSIKEIGSRCARLGVQILPIALSDLERIKSLPEIHKDPFDRLLVAQAQSGNLTIITKDSIIPQYDVKTIW